MGADTKAIIRQGVSLPDLANTLHRLGLANEKPEVLTTHSPSFFQLQFKYGEEQRLLSVHVDDCSYRDYKINGLLLSLGFWGSSVAILRSLCNHYGGYLMENDCGPAPESDFVPVTIEKYSLGQPPSPQDAFTNKVIAELGYNNLGKALELLAAYGGSAWVPVGVRLPEPGVWCLLTRTYGHVDDAFISDKNGRLENGIFYCPAGYSLEGGVSMATATKTLPTMKQQDAERLLRGKLQELQQNQVCTLTAQHLVAPAESLGPNAELPAYQYFAIEIVDYALNPEDLAEIARLLKAAFAGRPYKLIISSPNPYQ